MLKEVHGDNVMPRTQVFKWHKLFMEGREELEDDESPGCPTTSKAEENQLKFSE
jgi:hypothetical protein